MVHGHLFFFSDEFPTKNAPRNNQIVLHSLTTPSGSSFCRLGQPRQDEQLRHTALHKQMNISIWTTWVDMTGGNVRGPYVGFPQGRLEYAMLAIYGTPATDLRFLKDGVRRSIRIPWLRISSAYESSRRFGSSASRCCASKARTSFRSLS